MVERIQRRYRIDYRKTASETPAYVVSRVEYLAWKNNQGLPIEVKSWFLRPDGEIIGCDHLDGSTDFVDGAVLEVEDKASEDRIPIAQLLGKRVAPISRELRSRGFNVTYDLESDERRKSFNWLGR